MKHPSLFFVLLLAACAPAQPTPQIHEGAISSAQAAQSVSLPADPQHGELTHLAIGPLAGEGETLANGTGVLWAFEDGFSRVSIQLNIAEAPQGSVYIAWLRNPDGSATEKLGMLQNELGDVRHSLKKEAQKDYKRYSTMFVTLESSEGVSTPGRIVANGILKATAR